jgi:FixJ family two-component response regulator
MTSFEEEKPIVFVIDDSADVREGLMALLESAGLECRVFASPKEFVAEPVAERPSCVILDVRLPEMSGLEFQVELTRRPRKVPVIMITGHGDIPMSVRAMKSGAVEFLTKPPRDQDVLDAVYAALEEDRVNRRMERQAAELRARYDILTSREREILPLVTAGLLNKQIAAEVGLSEVTVKVHRHNMMAKLKAKTLPDLVRIAELLDIRRPS